VPEAAASNRGKEFRCSIVGERELRSGKNKGVANGIYGKSGGRVTAA